MLIRTVPLPSPGADAAQPPSSPVVPCPSWPLCSPTPPLACLPVYPLDSRQPLLDATPRAEALEELRWTGVGGRRRGTRLSTRWPWETLRRPSPNRDFAYVARDKLTQMLKCHVFRCEAPAKNIATSLHEICSKARPPHLD